MRNLIFASLVFQSVSLLNLIAGHNPWVWALSFVSASATQLALASMDKSHLAEIVSYRAEVAALKDQVQSITTSIGLRG